MARVEDLTVTQGTDAYFKVHIKETDGSPKDINGFVFTSSFKKSYTATTSTSFDVSIVDAVSGIISISLPSNTTLGMSSSTRYVYDVMMQDQSNNVFSILEGKIFVKPSVTRV